MGLEHETKEMREMSRTTLRVYCDIVTNYKLMQSDFNGTGRHFVPICSFVLS